jgi:hypothetical protein
MQIWHECNLIKLIAATSAKESTCDKRMLWIAALIFFEDRKFMKG